MAVDSVNCYNIWEHCFEKAELEAEIAGAGFGEIQLWGDIAGAPYSGDSKTICAVVRK